MRRVGVQADDLAAGHDPAGQQVQDPARAAAQGGRALPRPQAHPVQQRLAVRRQLVGLLPQPRGLPRVLAQRVHGVGLSAAADFPGIWFGSFGRILVSAVRHCGITLHCRLPDAAKA